MTTPSPTIVSTSDDLLIREAIRQRQLHRSGKSLAGALVLGVFFAAVGYVLAFDPGLINNNMPYPDGFPLNTVLTICGVLVLLVAAVFVASAVRGARPRAPWGDPVAGDCPVCNEPALRQDAILLREKGTLVTVASGTVTLCESPGCPHAAVEQ
jgi:Kef-type K+ transport system membrane component KefB